MQTFSIVYSLPYLTLFYIFLLISLFERNEKNRYTLKRIRLFSLIIFIVFFGLRGYVGWDWYGYTKQFESIIPLFHENYSNNYTVGVFEPGFILYMSIIKVFSTNYIFFVFISTIVSGIVFKKVFQLYIGNVAFGYAMIMIYGLNIQIDLMRNILALMLFLISLKYLMSRQKALFFVLNFIGISFHLSSILFLPLYFFIHKPIKRLLIYLLIIGNVIYLTKFYYLTDLITPISYFIGGTIQLKVENYSLMTAYSGRVESNLLYVIKMLTSIILLYYYNLLAKKDKFNIVFVNMLFMGILAFLFLAEFSVLFKRVQLLFVLSYCIVIPNLFKIIDLNYRRISMFVFIAFATLSIMQRFDVVLFKYDNVLFNAMSIEKRQTLFRKNASIIQPFN